MTTLHFQQKLAELTRDMVDSQRATALDNTVDSFRTCVGSRGGLALAMAHADPEHVLTVTVAYAPIMVAFVVTKLPI